MGSFNVDTEGHCFLCLEKTVTGKPETTSSTQSLQYLSLYLKMDRKKVFKEVELIPGHLLAKVEKSNLKAELCRECGLLNDQFSKLFRQLEMTELKLASCLDRVNRRLVGAGETGRLEQFKRKEGHPSGGGGGGERELSGKREIVEVLRREAMQKCRQKLNRVGIPPRVKVRRLRTKEINQKRAKLKLDSEDKTRSAVINRGFPPHRRRPMIESDERDGDFKTEHDFSNHAPDEYVDDGNYDDDHDSANFNEFDRPYMDYQPRPPLKENYVRSKAGKFVCKVCSMEYSNSGTFSRHYSTAHLKIRYKCLICEKEFNQKANLERHQKAVHK